MMEYVGTCHQCNKDIYCCDGFLQGVLDDQGRLSCFECDLVESTNLNCATDKK